VERALASSTLRTAPGCARERLLNLLTFHAHAATCDMIHRAHGRHTIAAPPIGSKHGGDVMVNAHSAKRTKGQVAQRGMRLRSLKGLARNKRRGRRRPHGACPPLWSPLKGPLEDISAAWPCSPKASAPRRPSRTTGPARAARATRPGPLSWCQSGSRSVRLKHAQQGPGPLASVSPAKGQSGPSTRSKAQAPIWFCQSGPKTMRG
jgi:hypothetical protein